MTDYSSIELLGAFETYTPDTLPDLAPPNALFMRRTSDGLDWYTNWAHQPDAFEANDVLATVTSLDNRGAVVQCVVRATNVQQIPVSAESIIVIKGVDPTIDKPHQLFEQRGFDAATLSIYDLPQPVVPVITYKKDIWERATDDEADTIDDILSSMTRRKQNMFRDAQYLDHTEALFTELLAAFVDDFGEQRAGELLAGS